MISINASERGVGFRVIDRAVARSPASTINLIAKSRRAGCAPRMQRIRIVSARRGASARRRSMCVRRNPARCGGARSRPTRRARLGILRRANARNPEEEEGSSRKILRRTRGFRRARATRYLVKMYILLDGNTCRTVSMSREIYGNNEYYVR